jgi:hypothetical protein
LSFFAAKLGLGRQSELGVLMLSGSYRSKIPGRCVPCDLLSKGTRFDEAVMSEAPDESSVADSPRILTTRTERIWMAPDGILRCECLPVSDHGLEDAKENVRLSAEVIDPARGKVPALIDARSAKAISRDARVYYTGSANAELLVAIALVVDSALSRIIGSFFLGLNKTPFPAKLFTSEDAALKWLRGFQ